MNIATDTENFFNTIVPAISLSGIHSSVETGLGQPDYVLSRSSGSDPLKNYSGLTQIGSRAT